MHQTPAPRDAIRARQLLQQGWSLRRVARALGLSRRTLERLLERPPDASAIPDDPFSQARRRAQRCPGCGGLVFHWPCLTCELREKEQRTVALRRAA